MSEETQTTRPLGGTAFSGTGAMDIQAILGMLPHRYPFLFVDRVTSCVPGKSIEGYKNLSGYECNGWNGSGGKCLPQVLILEALAQLSVVLTFKTLNVTPTGKELMFFAAIDNARFAQCAGTGSRLELNAQVTRIMSSKGIGKFSTRAEIGGIIVAEADMMAAMRL